MSDLGATQSPIRRAGFLGVGGRKSSYTLTLKLAHLDRCLHLHSDFILFELKEVREDARILALFFVVGGPEGRHLVFPVAGIAAAEAVVVAALGRYEFACRGRIGSC